MPAFNDNPNAVSVTKRRAISATKKSWSDEQKLELIKMYLMTGNLALSAASLKIPEHTARKWKGSNWWKEREHELRVQKDFKVSARLEKIIEKSLIAVEDRLDNGDFFFNRDTQAVERRPVSMQAAHKVAVDLMERKDVLDKRAEAGDTQEIAVDKFIQLAEKFASLAQKTQEKPPVEVTDVIYVNESDQEEEDDHAVHDEREEGLQERESEVQLETERTEEEEFEDDGETEGERLWSYEER